MGGKSMKRKIVARLFTHEQYRSAGVAHLVNMDQEIEFYYRGKPITKEQANEMVIEHYKRKNALSK